MTKSLIKLILLVTIPLVLLTSVKQYNPLFYFTSTMILQYYEEAYQGVFYLLELKLKDKSEEEWPRIIENLSSDFHHTLKVQSLSELPKHWTKNKKIKPNEYILFEAKDDKHILIKRIGNSSSLLVMHMDETYEQELINNSEVGVALVKDYLTQSKNPIASELSTFSEQFGFPFILTTPEEISLSNKQQQQIQKWGFAWESLDNEQEIFFIPTANNQTFVKAGPTPSSAPVNFRFLGLFIFLVLITLSLAISIWLYPLWRDLKKLDQSALAFGEGNLDERVLVRKASIAARLGLSFNNMADNIESLILSNRQLTNAVAHDLRTPLARLRFALEMLESDDCTAEDKSRYQQSLHKNMDNLDYLIDQLLTHSRYSRVADSKHFSSCNLQELIESEINAQAAGSQLHYVFKDAEKIQGISFWLDARAISRALQNLLNNASRYAKTSILLSVEFDENKVCINIEDDGPGIPEKDREQLLKPFTQLHNNSRDAKQGHGLGLAIVSQIAQWHQGTAEISDSPLGGAKISLCWPRKLAPNPI